MKLWKTTKAAGKLVKRSLHKKQGQMRKKKKILCEKKKILEQKGQTLLRILKPQA